MAQFLSYRSPLLVLTPEFSLRPLILVGQGSGLANVEDDLATDLRNDGIVKYSFLLEHVDGALAAPYLLGQFGDSVGIFDDFLRFFACGCILPAQFVQLEEFFPRHLPDRLCQKLAECWFCFHINSIKVIN